MSLGECIENLRGISYSKSAVTSLAATNCFIIENGYHKRGILSLKVFSGITPLFKSYYLDNCGLLVSILRQRSTQGSITINATSAIENPYNIIRSIWKYISRISYIFNIDLSNELEIVEEVFVELISQSLIALEDNSVYFAEGKQLFGYGGIESDICMTFIKLSILLKHLLAILLTLTNEHDADIDNISTEAFLTAKEIFGDKPSMIYLDTLITIEAEACTYEISILSIEEARARIRQIVKKTIPYFLSQAIVRLN